MEYTKDIIKKYRGEETQDRFAEMLTDEFGGYRKIRSQHISMWERGTVIPDMFAMIYLRDNSNSVAISHMAGEIVAIIQNGK
ncbi:hypothetical protein LCGC14_1189660 [marine sediment metagenome]|uniref:Uncharacterized protein n=1 Tax=marine sediment metagenome TaxID=412755 RepID=A0A0F9P2J4_9ZZZZ